MNHTKPTMTAAATVPPTSPASCQGTMNHASPTMATALAAMELFRSAADALSRGRQFWLALACGLALAACNPQQPEERAGGMADQAYSSDPAASSPAADEAAFDIDIVAAALVHPDRPAEDAENDERRKPGDVLHFAGLEAGMQVLEMEAGGGYYTEIIARAIGPAGVVYMQNPPAFDGFVGDAPTERAERLGNVIVSRTNFDDLEPADGSIDMVTWILGPHELWYEPEGQSLGDPELTFAEISRVLKPGGIFLAVDHMGAADSGPEIGGTLHRIRGDIVSDYAEQAGLTPLASSDIHQNDTDPLDNNVFEPSIRGQTSRFVMTFRK